MCARSLNVGGVMGSTINTEAAWAQRGREAAARTRAAKEVYDDERESRNRLVCEAFELGWSQPKIADWFDISRTTVVDIATGRKNAA
jgi:hypothetical protein